MVFTPSSMVTSSRFSQPLNAPLPMVFAPILREASALHPLNDPSPEKVFSFPARVSTEAGMTSDLMLLHP